MNKSTIGILLIIASALTTFYSRSTDGLFLAEINDAAYCILTLARYILLGLGLSFIVQGTSWYTKLKVRYLDRCKWLRGKKYPLIGEVWEMDHAGSDNWSYMVVSDYQDKRVLFRKIRFYTMIGFACEGVGYSVEQREVNNDVVRFVAENLIDFQHDKPVSIRFRLTKGS